MSSSSSSSASSSLDPSGTDPARLVRKVVKIHSLSSKPELNNKLGTVTSFSTDRNRYLVELYPPSATSPTISIRAENLVLASWKDKAQIQWDMFKHQAYTLYRDPHVRQQIRYLYSMMDRQLPTIGSFKIHPEHVGGSMLVLLIMMIWFLGMSKTILILSLASITIMVAMEDIMQALTSSTGQQKSLKGMMKKVLQNFPMRWRNVLAQSIGYPTISQRVAFTIWLGLVFFMLTVLFKTNPRMKHKPYSTSTNTPWVSTNATTASSTAATTTVPWKTLEEIYHLGFDDGNKSLTYGTSLPFDIQDYMIVHRLSISDENHPRGIPSHKNNNMNQDEEEEEEDDMDTYLSSLPPLTSTTYTTTSTRRKQGPKLGYTTIAAFYSLFRVIRELGFHDGKFDFNLLIANLKNLQPWRLGLIGLSLYKVISIFLF